MAFGRRIKRALSWVFGKLDSIFGKLGGSQARLEEKEETLEVILDNLGEGVLATDLQGSVVFANPAARAVLGMTEERAINLEAPQRLPNPFEDFDLREAVSRCANERECGQFRARRGDAFFRVKLNHLPTFDDNRGGVLVMVQDLSESHRLEANQQRFLARAAHQLKTPITAIMGSAELLDTGGEEDPAARRRLLDHILSEGRRMQRLSETLLRLASIGAERRSPDLEEVRPAVAARQAAERMKPLSESAGIGIEVEEREPSLILADPDHLEQVLMALLNNAINHSPRGGRVRVVAHRNILAVEDEGEGISTGDLPHIFERFYRGAGSTEGFGLGLSICKDLVEGMGGRVRVRSTEGEGAVFEMDLPESGKGA